MPSYAPPRFVTARGSRAARPVIERGADRVMTFLLLVGFAAASVVVYESRQATLEGALYTIASGNSLATLQEEVVKSRLYYVAHAIQITALILAGVLGLLRRSHVLPGRIVWLFALLQMAGFLMAFRGMSESDFFSTRLVSSTGPFVTLISLLAFVAMDEADFRYVTRLFEILAVGLCILLVFEMARMRMADRAEATAYLEAFLAPLYWVACWILLRPYPSGSLLLVARWVPVVLYLMGSVLVRTRLNFVMGFLLVGADVFVSSRRTGRRGAGLLGLLGLGVALLVIALVIGTESSLAGLVAESSRALGERLTEDSRSNQLIAFFQDVSPWELILGRGSRATWNWSGMSPVWAGGTDVGYLSLLFFGGVPLLLTYVAFHVIPAWRIVARGDAGPALVPAVIVLLWAVRMWSSSFPSLSFSYFVVVLCVGRCLAVEAAPRFATSATGPRYVQQRKSWKVLPRA